MTYKAKVQEAVDLLIEKGFFPKWWRTELETALEREVDRMTRATARGLLETAVKEAN
jgi:hypothetical protein